MAVENIEKVGDYGELICSQESQSANNRSTRKIAAELNIYCFSVQRIAKHDLRLTAFCCVPAQIILDAMKHKRLERRQTLLRRLPMTATKEMFSLTRRTFISTRELHGNGDGGNTAVTAVIPRIFPVNVAVIPRGWSKLLRGYRGNGAFVCDNTAVVNGCTLKSEV